MNDTAEHAKLLVKRVLAEAGKVPGERSIREIEDELYRGRHQLTVNKPVTLWKITSSKPLNAYYGSTRIGGPTTEQITLQPGASLWTANGVTYLDQDCKTKAVWSNPDDTGPFERSSNLGAYFAIAQKIRDGELELSEQAS